MPRQKSALFAVLLLSALFGAPASAGASAPVHLTATPVLGAASPVGAGWVSVHVRLVNPSAAELRGFVELRAQPGFGNENERYLTRLPFALPPRGRVGLTLPTHGFSGRPPELSVRVLDADRRPLAESPIGEFRQVDPLLFDLSEPSRIAATVRGMGVVLARRAGGGYRAPIVSVSSPSVDPATGEPVLPIWAPAYQNATLVVSPGRRLGTLPESELLALSNWVLAGGALAIAIERAEDLRSAPLQALVGGGPLETPPPSDLLEPATFWVPGEQALGRTPDPSLPQRSALRREELAPPSRLAARLHGYDGGNLRPTPWGASASYGLGEVHLLAFPIDEPAVTDRWVQLKLVDLVRHAWERQAAVALPLGQAALDDHRNGVIRRVLDPNENMRWTIIVSALILLLYAGLAGPLNFFLAARKGRPLRAVLWLPAWAAATMLAIVAVGVAGKGVRGRARKLALVEAGAGMSRAAVTRFRGLYASSARELTVRPTSRENLVDVASEDDFVERHLVVDRDGMRIEGLRAKPWQTLVVREDGVSELGGGVSLATDPSGELLVKNRTARDLVGVVVKTPDGSLFGFPRIADGAQARVGEGERLGSAASPIAPLARPLNASTFQKHLENHASGLFTAWSALETYAGAEVDWWPEGVPVLLAQLEGGEGRATDTGLEVDEDRVLVRVVGFGGVP